MIEIQEADEVEKYHSRKLKLNTKGGILKLIDKGKIDLLEASQLFKNSGIEGKLLAGEALLELGTKAQDIDTAHTYYALANEEFRMVDCLGANGPARLSAYVARARIEASFILARAYMGSENGLPPNNGDLAHKIDQTMLGALGLVSGKYFEAESITDRAVLSGQLAELGVLSLFKRFERQNINDQSYYAIPSLFTEDRWLLRESDPREPWDISVYTDTGEPKPNLNYRIQVKNYDAPIKRVEGSSLSWVNVGHDLAVYDGEQYVCVHIAREILAEWHEGKTNRATYNLNKRTERLLDTIDA